MEDTDRKAAHGPSAGTGIDRRAFFGRALLAAGATATLLTLSGCPGGDQDDDDDGDGEDDD
ncbi:hypothetical protein DMB66_02030 [Actinoplanes sp. ATCC 53533]|uniref:hypothetical protein n=1 Tax=Actinoplanes sp. ATCC 53533 TaxID=1288362 RepID=UPI000F794C30|nr:hypothetical protein [Actinoplanes sp. ATCC 53533]RSM74211.1 hypothetical protein DMB66_02030 [Actinoplanes sp. ATCC 53533]